MDSIRQYRADDLQHVVTLFKETIHTINQKDYTPEQINAWAPQHIDAQKWGVKLLQHHTVVAETNGVITGFGDIDATGYFDHLFVHKDFQGLGIAKKIVAAIEAHARRQDFETITVAVSITAKTFFLKQGYTIVNPQQVSYNGQDFTNYFMKKDI
ncbi:MAG: GNAT family N-acetyltransferase [Bacteroidota bacterium]